MTTKNIQAPANENPDLVNVTITYLKQDARPDIAQPARPPFKTAILRAVQPPVHYYRYLYRLVGDPYKWVSRNILSDDALMDIIHNKNVYVYVFYIEGNPAGLCEVDDRNQDFAEIKFFGLAPEAIGRGIGRYFLWNAIEMAWALNPSEVRLETCTLDHPAALPLYQKFGFSVHNRRKGVVDISSLKQRHEQV